MPPDGSGFAQGGRLSAVLWNVVFAVFHADELGADDHEMLLDGVKSGPRGTYADDDKGDIQILALV